MAAKPHSVPTLPIIIHSYFIQSYNVCSQEPSDDLQAIDGPICQIAVVVVFVVVVIVLCIRHCVKFQNPTSLLVPGCMSPVSVL